MGDVLAHDLNGAVGCRQHLVMRDMRENRAGQVGQRRLDPRPVQSHADRIGPARIERQHRRRLAALPLVAFAERADQAVAFEMLDDLPDRGIGQRRRPRQIRPRRLAKAAQALEDQPLIIMPDMDRRGPLTGIADGHGRLFPPAGLRRRQLCSIRLL